MKHDPESNQRLCVNGIIIQNANGHHTPHHTTGLTYGCNENKQYAIHVNTGGEGGGGGVGGTMC